MSVSEHQCKENVSPSSYISIFVNGQYEHVAIRCASARQVYRKTQLTKTEFALKSPPGQIQ